MTIVEWIKRNKLACLLLVVVGYLLLKGGVGFYPLVNRYGGYESNLGYTNSVKSMEMPRLGAISDSYGGSGYPPAAAPSDTKDRMVIQDTSLSIMVKDVSEAIKGIEAAATKYGGYMVSSHLSKPEGAASGSITVRILSDKRQEALSEFKRLGVKTVSESVSGRDVTDQYEDLEAQLVVYEKMKAKYEEIMAQAFSVTDLMSVQRELISVQSQIDSVKGRQRYLEQTARLTKVTAYLSTDELALPYAPDAAWRPALVFKQAVRSFIGTVRSLGNSIIWAGVYAPIWLPVLLIWLFLWRKRRNVKSAVSASPVSGRLE